MKKYIQVNSGGEIVTVLNSVGQVTPDFIEVDSSLSDVALLENYYFKYSLKYRGSKPGDFYNWNNVDELWVVDLIAMMSTKSADIELSCASAIVSGFVSYALGAPYHYPSKTTDQQNLAASVLASYDPENPANWLTPFWCADVLNQWAYRPHTGAQIREVGRDAKSAVIGFQFHNEQLQAQIRAATTPEEIEAITWSN